VGVDVDHDQTRRATDDTGDTQRVPGVHPERASYGTFAAFKEDT
jgi:hypothetical protein